MAKYTKIVFRLAEEKDAEEICRIQVCAIRLKCSTCYTETVVKAWLSNLYKERFLPFIRANEIIVADDKDLGRIVGFGHLKIVTPFGNEEENESVKRFEKGRADYLIKGLYVEPASIGKGVGTSLMNRMESWAIGKGAIELNVFSSLNAVSFYEKCGFVRKETQLQDIPSGNCSGGIHCVKMTKFLSDTVET